MADAVAIAITATLAHVGPIAMITSSASACAIACATVAIAVVIAGG